MTTTCPYCAGGLAKEPQRQTTCPHCGEGIHVNHRQILYPRALLTATEASAALQHERDAHVAKLNLSRDLQLEQLARFQRETGVAYEVQIVACCDALTCASCQALHGRRFTLEEVRRLRPLPCPDCTTTLFNRWKGVCRCTYMLAD